MFPGAYFAARYFPTSYFPKVGATPLGDPSYFVHSYFAGRYFPDRYFPGIFPSVIPPIPPEPVRHGGGFVPSHQPIYTLAVLLQLPIPDLLARLQIDPAIWTLALEAELALDFTATASVQSAPVTMAFSSELPALDVLVRATVTPKPKDKGLTDEEEAMLAELYARSLQ